VPKTVSHLCTLWVTRRNLELKTASGIPLNDNDMTAAHKSLPFGSKVRVINKKNGNAVTVTITDRGPYAKGRCIDLSRAGAGALGFAGLAPVSVVHVMSD
jgi:rare lipoprotein A